MMRISKKHRDKLRQEYKNRNLTLYLGAGVSIGSGLPSWEKLVVMMYLQAIKDQNSEVWLPDWNYLFAVAQWHIERLGEPSEVTARKLRESYNNDDEFFDILYKVLYKVFKSKKIPEPLEKRQAKLLDKNNTLKIVSELCQRKNGDDHYIKAVVTYNYDSLLETDLMGSRKFVPVWKDKIQPFRVDAKPGFEKLPIYHVHGYIPLEKTNDKGSYAENIIFTEEDYNAVARTPYHWSNIVQIRYLSGTTGLMIGLSLTDRNMRRLLDALAKTPVPKDNYILLQRPKFDPPKDYDFKEISEIAEGYSKKLKDRQIDLGQESKAKFENFCSKIGDTLKKVQQVDKQWQDKVLSSLDIIPIWYDKHDEIQEFIESIME